MLNDTKTSIYLITVGAASKYDCGDANAIIECKMDNFGVSQLKPLTGLNDYQLSSKSI